VAKHAFIDNKIQFRSLTVGVGSARTHQLTPNTLHVIRSVREHRTAQSIWKFFFS
jgi:hypothetical protein